MSGVLNEQETKDELERAKKKVQGDNGEASSEGWTDTRAERSGAFYDVESKEKLKGVLLGRYPKSGHRKGFFYQVRTTAICKAKVKIGHKEYEEEEIEIGTIVSIDERAALKDWRKLITDSEENGTEYEVMAQATEKRQLDSGNWFWDFDLKHRIAPVPF